MRPEKRSGSSHRRVLPGVGCIALAATATLGHALLAAQTPAGGRALFEPAAGGVRFGVVDAGIDLLLDTRALMACGLVCVVALAAAILLATRPAPERGWRPWAWLQLAMAGALLSFLADGFVAAAVGWTLAAAAGAWLAGWHDARAGVVVATRGAVALSAMLLGAALLFWGLGGSWDDDGYIPDGRPRVVPVQVGAGAADSSLMMTSLAGATIFVDDARTPSLRVPFARATLAAGVHSLRVHAGDGTDDAKIAHLEVSPGEELALVPWGPTLSFHTLADELSLRGTGGAPAVRRTTEQHVGPGGFAVIAGVLLALLGAAGAMSAWSVPLAAPRVLSAVAAGGTTSAIGPFLLVRLALLFPSAEHTGIVVSSVGAAVLLGTVWHALGYVGLRRWLVFAGGAPSGLTFVALGLGGVVPAMEVMLAAGGLAALAHLLAARAGEDQDALAAARVTHDDGLLVRVPERLGELLASMERWVVGAAASAIAGVARIAAWMVATADEHLVATPGDVAASGAEAAARRIVPWIGVSLSSVAWTALAVGALAALLRAVWPEG